MLADKHRELVADVRRQESELSDQKQSAQSEGTVTSAPTHPADVGTEIEQRSLNADLLARQRALLREVEDALRRIDDGVYGICQATGEPIEIKRLLAKPWARLSRNAADQELP